MNRWVIGTQGRIRDPQAKRSSQDGTAMGGPPRCLRSVLWVSPFIPAAIDDENMATIRSGRGNPVHFLFYV